MPTSLIHESLSGTLHKKFNPRVSRKAVKTNNPLVGNVNRVSHTLEYSEYKAFCLRAKIPCGMKKNGTTSQYERSRITKSKPFASVALNSPARPTINITGVNTISKQTIHTSEITIV